MAHNPQLEIVLGKNDTTLVVEELQSFAAFDRAMDEQLTQLVTLWIHCAAPNAARLERVQRRFGR